jgi:hypothetical protein
MILLSLLPSNRQEAAISRFSPRVAPGLVLAACLLSGCADGDPNNLGSYYSCSDWMIAHQGTVRRRTSDQAAASATVLDDWVVERALDRGYEVTEAPGAGNNYVSEALLVERVTAQCTSDRVVQTLGGAITAVLDRLDAERASKPLTGG